MKEECVPGASTKSPLSSKERENGIQFRLDRGGNCCKY